VQALVVPLVVVGTLVSMLVPLPPTLMDFLIGANLVFALALLLSALALTDTLKLTSLPSLLLLATLFRLALNVSSTRNILSGGEAGEIIDAFGKVVVGGNLIVGVVIFAIITLVQFIVVAKGSERVAEVAARFTLDALPGKQMSIDADLRSGVLDLSQARAKRQDLQTESRFYGALDGAMKFVKGDAIAGIVITLINLIGGISVGVLVAGLDISTAIHKFSLLTVGDGLTAQIPSLLNSLAAGIVVTRVSRGDERTLAQDLMQQLSAARSVKVIVAVFCVGLACAPDMPVLPFITLGAILIWSAINHRPEQLVGGGEATAWTPRLPAAVSVSLSSERFSALLGSAQSLAELNTAVRSEVYSSLGLVIPNVEVTPLAVAGGIVVAIRGVSSSELSNVESSKELAKRVSDVVKDHALELVDDAMTRRLIDSLDPTLSDSANVVIPSVISVTQVTELLKALVGEGVSIRSFDVILQAVSEHAPRTSSSRVLLEEVRIALKRVIYAGVNREKGRVRAIRLNPILDYEISKLERDGAQLSLPLAQYIAAFAIEHAEVGVLLVSRGARRLVKQLCALHRLSIAVVAFEELLDDVRVEFVASLEGAPVDELPILQEAA
jgi:type III secretion protein V